MKDKKNKAYLDHLGKNFTIWQDEKDYWWFSLGTMPEVNTQNKDLQTALNIVYESINDTMPKKKMSKR
jgi:hypothetical protein